MIKSKEIDELQKYEIEKQPIFPLQRKILALGPYVGLEPST